MDRTLSYRPLPVATFLLTGVLFSLTMLVSSQVFAQPASHIYRIGRSYPGPTPAPRFSTTQAFVDGMREHGFVEGRDYVFEDRGMPDEKFESYAKATEELVRLPVDLLLVGVCGVPMRAAKMVTQTIPIVVGTCNDDMVEAGFVKSLAHPGGNITGQSKLTPELAPKRLSLLKQTLPRVNDVAVLWNPDYADFKADWRELRAAATRLSISLHPVEFRRPEEFEAAFEEIRRQHVGALITFSDVQSWFFADRIAKLAASSHLPVIAPFRDIPDAGGLMSYGPSLIEMWHDASSYVAKILKGANPGDLPVEQPRHFELIINLKAARTLGITIPPGVLLQADQLIE
jgi:putative tryptophan/tyrosine transport system substrate-binding protein